MSAITSQRCSSNLKCRLSAFTTNQFGGVQLYFGVFTHFKFAGAAMKAAKTNRLRPHEEKGLASIALCYSSFAA